MIKKKNKKSEILRELRVIADQLDKRGLYKDANVIDSVLRALAADPRELKERYKNLLKEVEEVESELRGMGVDISDELSDEDDYEEYITYDRYQDLTAPGIYDREPDEPGMDYGPDEDDGW